MTKNDWGIEIIWAQGGFVVKDNEGKLYPIAGINEKETSLNLLWFIIDYFCLRPSKYERDCIYADTEVGGKYELKSNEKFVSEHERVIKL